MSYKIDLFKDYLTTSVVPVVSGELRLKWYLKYFKWHLLPHFPKNKDARILELGCGCGINIHSLKINGYENIQGVDICDEQIKYAKEQFHLETVYVGDAFNYLEHNTEKYDVIVLIDILEHLEAENSVYLLKLVRAALTSAGRVIIQAPCAFSLFSPNYFRDITHKRAYSPQSMTQSLLMAGYEKFDHYSLGPVPNGVLSATRWVLWNMFIAPAISAFMLTAYGERMGGIYTANMLSVVDCAGRGKITRIKNS